MSSRQHQHPLDWQCSYIMTISLYNWPHMYICLTFRTSFFQKFIHCSIIRIFYVQEKQTRILADCELMTLQSEQLYNKQINRDGLYRWRSIGQTAKDHNVLSLYNVEGFHLNIRWLVENLNINITFCLLLILPKKNLHIYNCEKFNSTTK